MEKCHIYLKQKQSICGDRPIPICNVQHIVTKVDFWVLASFRACQEQLGTFSILPFCTELLMNLLLHIKQVSRRLEIQIKKFALNIYKGYWVKVWEFGIRWNADLYKIYLFGTLTLNRDFTTFETSLKIFEKEFPFSDVFCKPCKECHLAQMLRHFYV